MHSNSLMKIRLNHTRSLRGGLMATAVLASLASVFVGPLHAQALNDRIVSLPSVQPADRAKLGANFVGWTPSSQVIPLSITLPLRNTAQLNIFLKQLYDPTSPQFHHYMTGAQFDSQFGPTQSDYDQVVSWALSQGLTITKEYSSRTILSVKGNAASVERAFGVQLANLSLPDGSVVHTHVALPQVPLGIGSIISGVLGLSNANARHTHVVRKPASVLSQFPLDSSLSKSGVVGTGPAGGLAPSDFRKAYSLTGNVTTPGGQITLLGAGESVALYELDTYFPTDIQEFANEFSLGSPELTDVPVDGFDQQPTLDLGQVEVVLDIDMVLSLAPYAHVYVYQAANQDPDATDMYQQIADDFDTKQTSVVSTSWGIDETDGLDSIPAETTAFQKMLAQGQTIYAAAGDDGAYDNFEEDPTAAVLSVDDPASQPDVTGVGGTRITTNGPGGAYVSETSWDSSPLADGPEGGGGGISSQWPLQSWESGTFWTNLKITNRTVPDVSLNADPDTGYDIFVGDLGGWQTIGGTSAAAPLWTSMTALANELRTNDGLGTNLGFANPTYYTIGDSYSATSTTTNYAASFHDITTGNNLFYDAGPGYDMSTGWGSFFGDAMIAELAGNAIAALPKGTLTGTVTDSASTPVVGAVITALTTGNGQLAGTATTNALGVYTVSLPVGIPLNVSADGSPTGATYAGQTVNDVKVSTTAATTLNFTLQAVTAYTQNTINFISVPYDYTGIADFATIFDLSTPLTASDPKLFYWDPINFDYVQTPVSPADTFHLGYGYWVDFPSSSTGWYLHRQGVAASLAIPFTFRLQPGWNMIGDPFLQDYPISGIQISPQTIAGTTTGATTSLPTSTLVSPILYYYTGGSGNYTALNASTDSLKEGLGEWLYCYSTTGAVMSMTPISTPVNSHTK